MDLHKLERDAEALWDGLWDNQLGGCYAQAARDYDMAANGQDGGA